MPPHKLPHRLPQHIYSFTGAANALQDVQWSRQGMYGAELGRTLTLTASFRMGPEVAAVGNMWVRRAPVAPCPTPCC
mgnify:CR=1 FL=1